MKLEKNQNILTGEKEEKELEDKMEKPTPQTPVESPPRRSLHESTPRRSLRRVVASRSRRRNLRRNRRTRRRGKWQKAKWISHTLSLSSLIQTISLSGADFKIWIVYVGPTINTLSQKNLSLSATQSGSHKNVKKKEAHLAYVWKPELTIIKSPHTKENKSLDSTNLKQNPRDQKTNDTA